MFIEGTKFITEPAFKETAPALTVTLCDIESALIGLCTCFTSLYNLTRSQNRHQHVETSTPPNISKIAPTYGYMDQVYVLALPSVKPTCDNNPFFKQK